MTTLSSRVAIPEEFIRMLTGYSLVVSRHSLQLKALIFARPGTAVGREVSVQKPSN